MKRATYWKIGIGVAIPYLFVAGYAHGFWSAFWSVALFGSAVLTGWSLRDAQIKDTQ